jgi:hypothetical protein
MLVAESFDAPVQAFFPLGHFLFSSFSCRPLEGGYNNGPSMKL